MSMRGFYRTLLSCGFKESEEDNRMAFAGERIMGFSTYDDDMSVYFAAQAFEVARAISHGTTFEFIEEPNQYKMYLTMCNVPFFSEKIEWGTSIRGAWWVHSDIKLHTCDLFTFDGKQVVDPLFKRDEWIVFMEELESWAKEA